MNSERWSNVTRARLAYASGDTRSGGSPLEAFFEISARCNLRCQMCAINYDQRYKPRAARPPFFEPELFATLRPIFPKLLRVFLFGLGEPLLNPHLTDYIRELAGHGVDVAFNTNATLIDDAKARELKDAGVARITVSIDGATAATYEEIRRGAKFARVIGGIEALVRAGIPVDLSMVAMRSNVDEIPRLVELASELGATAVHVEPLFSQVGSPELDEHYARENLGLAGATRAEAAFETARELATQRGIRFGSRFVGERKHFDYVEAVRAMTMNWACSEPWQAIWITTAGEVRTCCLNDMSFGNLFEQTFDDIWNGPLFRRLREQHAKRETADGCGNCIANGRMRNSPFFVPTRPVTYRPYFDAIPVASPDDPIRFDSPDGGITVTSPITISGTLREGVNPASIEVMLDHTPAANLNDAALFDGRSFVLQLAPAWLGEGAHMLWARERYGRGFAYREVHFWRPSRDGESLALPQATFAVPTRRRNLFAPTLQIDGRSWPTRWKRMSGTRGLHYVGNADLTTLAAGLHEMQIVAAGRVVRAEKLRRM